MGKKWGLVPEVFLEPSCQDHPVESEVQVLPVQETESLHRWHLRQNERDKRPLFENGIAASTNTEHTGNLWTTNFISSNNPKYKHFLNGHYNAHRSKNHTIQIMEIF